MKGPAFELVKVFHPNVIHLQYQMEECHKILTDSMDDSIIRHNVNKPLPLGGPPSQMNAAYYPDVGLEQMVPDQMWIEEEFKYDITAMYGISHWWFQRQRFYIDRHTSEGDSRAVRTHMRILSVIRTEVFSMYGDARLIFKSIAHQSVGFNSLVHSLRALSTLRRSGLRTASAAAKPCQGDSSELYLITSRIPTVAAAGQRDVNSQPHDHTLNALSMT
uniref:Uncharacterized protein n=1 Tax=Tanacetum cinerariifolium TaxID=118510 RepID=A0A6L2KHH2_TANCI|nr:hypothetical protein [Tanacetum cinerariifolium]